MPENTVYVGRGSKWGNPFPVTTDMPLDKSLELYRDQLDITGLKELQGKNLACWCPLDKPCHADILLELANK